LRTLYGGLAQSLALGGRLAEADKRSGTRSEQAVVSPMMVTDFENLTAITLFSSGAPTTPSCACARLARAGEWANRRAELMALHGLARMRRVGDDDIRAVEERVGRGAVEPAPVFATGVLTMVHAAHAGDPALMAEAAAHFAATGMALGAAEGYAAACRSARIRPASHPGAAADTWLAVSRPVRRTMLVARDVEALTDRSTIAALPRRADEPRHRGTPGHPGRTVENCLHRASPSSASRPA
jgi:hypothetical protein